METPPRLAPMLMFRLGLALCAAVSPLALSASTQAQPAAPAEWCLHWTDNCVTCNRANAKADAACSAPRPGCAAGSVRCRRADTAALRAACEKVNWISDNSCNSCFTDSKGRKTCTLILCAPRDIVCLVPRR